jgi:hypothetical protein
MATRADALEELRIAKMVLQIAKDNNYSKVIVFLDDNVHKAQNALDAFDRYSPRKLLGGLLKIVAPNSFGPALPSPVTEVISNV